MTSPPTDDERANLIEDIDDWLTEFQPSMYEPQEIQTFCAAIWYLVKPLVTGATAPSSPPPDGGSTGGTS
jgi:hypothetical protein